MSRLTEPLSKEQLQKRLFSQTIRPRKWHLEPGILVPIELAPFKQGQLFRPERRLRVLELGSGWGEYVRAFLQNRPDCDYVAFEIKADRIHQTLKHINKIPNVNFHIIPVNFNWFLAEILPARAFDRVIINFPDPWPKRRHWKHRLIQPEFPHRLHPVLSSEGEVHIATDYGPYARKILKVFRQSELYSPLYSNPDYLRTSPDGFYKTKFENIHKALGKRPYYMAWKKIVDTPGDR